MCSGIFKILSADDKAVSMMRVPGHVWTLWASTFSFAEPHSMLTKCCLWSFLVHRLWVSSYSTGSICWFPPPSLLPQLLTPSPSPPALGGHRQLLVCERKKEVNFGNFHQKKVLRTNPPIVQRLKLGTRRNALVRGPRIKYFHSQTLIHHP